MAASDRRFFSRRLEQIDGWPSSKETGASGPARPLAPLADPGERHAFLAVIDDTIRQLDIAP
ncbi:MAG: hypothetical protein ACREX8_15435 [Gammaproteobacteria bacterium]